ncbi:MAG: DOMON-like domain-containing protein [Syntrophobacteraceae bacterium]
MSCVKFSLRPFVITTPPPGIEITGSIGRFANMLRFETLLSGDLSQIDIPAPVEVSCRKSGLWEETCFEFFLAPKGLARYWEFNLSPAGHWNVYRFTGYREGMQESPSFASLPFSVGRGQEYLSILMEVQLDGIIEIAQPMEAAISMVVKDRFGENSYWALTHLGPRADFHQRESFLVEL